MYAFRPACRHSLRTYSHLLAMVVLLLVLAASASAGTVTVRWEFGSDDLRLEKAGEYTRLILEDPALVSEIPGAPSLPARHVYVVVPSGATVTGISSTAAEEVVARDVLVYPAQPALTPNEPPPFVPPDAAAYSSTSKLPAEPAVTEGTGILHGYRLAVVRLNPVRYVAGKKELYLARTIEATLTYDEGRAAVASVRPPQPRAGDEVRALVSNPQDVDAFSRQVAKTASQAGLGAAADEPLAGDTTGVYLLITNEALAPSFQPLVDRRTGQGKTGKLVTTEWIYANCDGTRPDGGTDNQTKIRNCIINHYYNHGTQWVCLGGDETVVPPRYCSALGESLIADWYYADVDGTWDADANGIYADSDTDLLPELWIGRVPVRTSGQGIAYVDKVLRYETRTPEGFADSMLLSGDWQSCLSGQSRPTDFRDHDPVDFLETLMRGIYRETIQPYWQAASLGELFNTFSTWDSDHCGDYRVSYEHMVDALNRGYHHIWLTGHGNQYGGAGIDWSMPSLLANTDKPSIMYVASCTTAALALAEPCCSEAFIRANGGAVAYIGATGLSAGVGTDTRLFYEEVFRNRRATIGEALTWAWRREPPPHYIQMTLHGDPAIPFLGPEGGRHLQVLSPKGCEVIDVTADVVLRWNAAGTGFYPQEAVKLEYSSDSGKSWSSVSGAEVCPYNGCFFIWRSPGLQPGTQYRVRVTSLAHPEVSDTSGRDFTVAPMRLLTVRSTPKGGIPIAGSKPNATDYTYSVQLGESVTLIASRVNWYEFVRWVDGSGNTITQDPTISFVIADDKTVIAEYRQAVSAQDCYVNDESPEDGLAPGDDNNDGLSPARPVRHIQQILDRYVDIGRVHVSAGTYVENVRIGFAALAHPNLNLLGAGGGATVIDGNRTQACIWLVNAQNVTISGFAIRNGKSGRGGGINVVSSSVVISGNVITGNTATAGGAIGLYKSSANIENNIIEHNTATTGSGVYFADSGPLIVRDCVLAGNSATGFGGGIACTNSSPVIRNCTVADNSGSSGGGVYAENGSSAAVSNCIVWGNLPDQIAGPNVPSVTYSDVQGSWPGGTGNIDLDPLFTGPAYRICVSSPCRNAGDPASIPLEGETDIDGQPRVLSGRVDIGADEYTRPGDIDGDGSVDVTDLLLLAQSFGESLGDPGYDLCCDMNGDGHVDVSDLLILAGNFGKPIPGDANGDGRVDVSDLLLLAQAFGSVVGDPAYSAACDFNTNGAVDTADLLILAGNWGT